MHFGLLCKHVRVDVLREVAIEAIEFEVFLCGLKAEASLGWRIAAA